MIEKKEFWMLNWLRFTLAVYLVLFHTLNNHYVEIKNNRILSAVLGLGNLATSIFFVLSGFLLTYVYLYSRDGRTINARAFLIARLSALYPAHILTFLLSLPAVVVALCAAQGIVVEVAPFTGIMRSLSWSEILASVAMTLTLTHAWNPLYLAFNAPSWSISTLLFFYILFPYVAPRFHRIRNVRLGLLILGLVFLLPGALAHMLNLTDAVTDGVLHRNPIVRLPLFLAGILICVIYARFSQDNRSYSSPKSQIYLPALVIAVLLIAAYFQSEYPTQRLYLITNGLYFPAALAVIWMFATIGEVESAWHKKWSSRLGKTSLSIFALHFPLFELFSKIERFVPTFFSTICQGGDIGSWIAAARDTEQTLYLYPLYFVGTIYGALIFQERIVVPVQQSIKSRFDSKSPSAYPTAISKSVSAEISIRRR